MIYVFKTSVSKIHEADALRPILDRGLPNSKWNFDIEDCDHILRVDSENEIAKIAINILQENGYACEELSE